MWKLALVVSWLVLLVPAIVQAEETPAAPAATATPATATATPAAAESSDDIQKHSAAGEVKFGDKWMPIMDLFAMYYKTSAGAKGVAADGVGDKDRLTELTKALAQILADWRKEKQPVDAEKTEALGNRELAGRLLATRPPPPPKLLYPPARQEGGGGQIYSDGSFSFGIRNNDDTIRRIEQENEKRQEVYQSLLAQYNENQRRGAALLAQSTGKINECDKKLKACALARAARERPLLEERVKVNERLRSIPTAVGSKMGQASGMAAALRASPLSLRNSKGIVEWKTQFYLLADLERMYKEVKGEIDDARGEAEAKALLNGKELPKDWRHPKSEEAESLNQSITHHVGAVELDRRKDRLEHQAKDAPR
jgi:hypothetical protein